MFRRRPRDMNQVKKLSSILCSWQGNVHDSPFNKPFPNYLTKFLLQVMVLFLSNVNFGQQRKMNKYLMTSYDYGCWYFCCGIMSLFFRISADFFKAQVQLWRWFFFAWIGQKTLMFKLELTSCDWSRTTCPASKAEVWWKSFSKAIFFQKA